MKKILILPCFLLTCINLFPQSAYTADAKKDIVISVLAISVFSWHRVTENELILPNNLDKNDVNAFDRLLMFPANEQVKNFRDTARFLLPVLPIIVPLASDIRYELETWGTYGLMYVNAALLTSGTTGLLKKNISRCRPLDYYKDEYTFVHADSFPSDTNALSFLAATFLSVTFLEEYPDSSYTIPVIAGSYSLASIISVSSILCGMHYITDVLAAAAIGSFYGWLIPALHKRNNNDDAVSFFVVPGGAVITIKI